MEIGGYVVYHGNSLTALVNERARADALAITLRGYVEALYRLTDEERKALLAMQESKE